MKPITIWHRLNDKKVFEFNHIEDGHTDKSKPLIKHMDQHKAWPRATWEYEHAYLNEEVPPHVHRISGTIS